jgi:hypothetical protein
MPLNINNLTAGTPVTFNAQTSAQRMVFDSATVAFRIVNNTPGIVTVMEENSDSFICQVDPGATAFGLIQNAIFVEAQYPGPVTLTPYTWTPVSSTGANTFTGGNTFVSPSVTSSGILVQSNGTISGNEPAVVVNNNVSAVFQGAEKTTSNTVQFLSNQFHNALTFYRSNGTYASKTGVLNNNSLVQMLAFGWDGVSQYRLGAGISWSATEVWSGTACGSQQSFFVVPNGTTSIRTAAVIRNDGVVEPGFGVRFGSAGLSVLSTYEEGTWTPGVRSTGATFSVNATETVGRYIRIGKIVHVEFSIELSGATTGTTTNICWLQNLPYAAQLLGTKLNWRPVLGYEGFTIGSTNGGINANLTTSTEFSLTFVRDSATMGALSAGMFSGSGARIAGAFSYQVA